MKKSRFTVNYSFMFADEWFQNLLEYIFQSYRNSMQPNEQKSTLRQKVSICMKHFWQIVCEKHTISTVLYILFKIFYGKETQWCQCSLFMESLYRTKQSPAVVFLEHFVFLSTSLVRWTWPKLYTTTGQEWENRKYQWFDW